MQRGLIKISRQPLQNVKSLSEGDITANHHII